MISNEEMNFISSQNFDSEAEKLVWEALKVDLKGEKGITWHRHPITHKKGYQLEPDFTIIGRNFGLRVIEAKGMRIEEIQRIEGYNWVMDDKYYKKNETPIEQVRTHRFAISDRLRDSRGGILLDQEGNSKIHSQHFVALPYITESEWDAKFSNSPNVSKDNLIFKSDIDAHRLKEILATEKVSMRYITDEEWNIVAGVLTTGDALAKEPTRQSKGDTTLSYILKKVEQRISYLDIEQHKVAIQIPEGPQRIRGLAGTGKTVILAMKVAQMHIRNPEWRIAITYYTRTLAVQIRNYILKFYRHMLDDENVEPDWKKIDIFHGWGSIRSKDGLYAMACGLTNHNFRDFSNAINFFSTQSGSVALDKCCQEILDSHSIPEVYDSILIDEAQDFRPYFFRLCRELLTEPKRLIWGYDDLQTLDDIEVPTVDKIFGFDKSGNPLVDLTGVYPGEIEKDMVLHHCYRNPRPVIIAAHTFGLGLFRKKGAVQFIESVEGWRDIGYEISNIESGTLPAGELITILRPQVNSPHLLETLFSYNKIVRFQQFTSREDEILWICQDIGRNINVEGLNPEDIVIISLDSRKKNFSSEITLFSKHLADLGVQIVSGSDDPDNFSQKDKVLITSIFRAKGNEAPMVYVYGFERVNGSETEILQNRNRAFTAMTRAKGWLILTGLGEVAEAYFEEINHALSEMGKFTFIVPDKRLIRRNLETHEQVRRRKQKDQAQKSARQLIRDLRDVDPNDLSAEDRRLLIKLLMGNDGQESL